jgi:hypothetical protein
MRLPNSFDFLNGRGSSSLLVENEQSNWKLITFQTQFLSFIHSFYHSKMSFPKYSNKEFSHQIQDVMILELVLQNE